MKKYEVMYILNASLEDSARSAAIDNVHGIITTNGGSIAKVDEWGVKEFAYKIENMTRGYYAVIDIECDNACLTEFNRLMRINKDVVRFMIIKKD